MKILGIDGSPRKNGNTEKLVKTILQGAEANGAETRHYKAARMNISPCPGCMDCRESGICSIVTIVDIDLPTGIKIVFDLDPKFFYLLSGFN